SAVLLVAEQMGLTTNTYKSIDILTNKDKFRQFLIKHEFFTPTAEGFNTVNQAMNGIKKFNLPVIIKPVDSSGSKGVSKLSNAEDLEKKFKYALNYSKVKRVIIEEYVEMDGYQVAGDGFAVNGQLMFRCFANDHFNNKGLNPYVPISASFPYDNRKEIHDKIHNEIQRLLTLLDMKTGEINFYVHIYNEENVYIRNVVRILRDK